MSKEININKDIKNTQIHREEIYYRGLKLKYILITKTSSQNQFSVPPQYVKYTSKFLFY